MLGGPVANGVGMFVEEVLECFVGVDEVVARFPSGVVIPFPLDEVFVFPSVLLVA